MQHERTTLPNGIRVLVAEMPETRSVSLSLYVGGGSRVEDRLTSGSSHFLEHALFKGTAKRPTAAEISMEIESRGGAVNASTDREVTSFWSRVPARHWSVALDVVADMLRAPLLRDRDIESERAVIVEEIRMYRDQPQDRVHGLLEAMLYPRHPLGWEVAGQEKVVRTFTGEGLRAFMRRAYAPSRMVLAIAGRLDAREALAAASEALGGLAPVDAPPSRPAPRPGRRRHRTFARRGEQAHLVMAWPTVGRESEERYAIELLSAALGEGMSSRLFLEVREKRSLAYDIHSYVSEFADAGHLAVYAGIAPERVIEARDAIGREIDRLRDEPIGEVEMDRIRDNLKARTELRLEETRGVASWLAGQELFLGRVRTVEEVCAIIDGIGADDILRAARRYLLPEQLYLAAVGPRAVCGALDGLAAEPVALEEVVP